jgi:antagonist of KipI
MSMTIIKPGMLSSFQDMGRWGFQHLGVPVGGVMDTFSHRLANLLVGNLTDQATLEMTVTGPVIQFEHTACIALAGADLSPTINGKPIPMHRPLIVQPADTLRFGERRHGARTYMALHGGADIEAVLNSYSTQLRGQLGGYKGRALKTGDTIAFRQSLRTEQAKQLQDTLDSSRFHLPALPLLATDSPVRVLTGPHTPMFTPASQHAFFNTPFVITAQSERMGYRLKGESLQRCESTQIVSEATGFGTIQVPPDGHPIVLMADRQTTGGYPKIAHVASIDLPRLAQKMPGDTLFFREITLDEAHALQARREAGFERLHQDLHALRSVLHNSTA